MKQPAGPPRLGRQIAVASAYAVLQRFGLRLVGFFSTLLLVRILAPADFGIAVVAMTLYAILDTVTMTGFGMALVRMAAPRREHYDTVFTLTLMRNLIIAAVMIASAGTYAEFMGDPRLVAVMWLPAFSVILIALESTRMVDLQRDLRFDVLLKYNLALKMLSTLITIGAALWLQNYWALVLGGPISRLLFLPISYWIAPYRPRLSLQTWRELFHFSKWLALGNLCSVVDGQLMTLVIGRTQGIAAVGYFAVGQQIALLPASEIAAPLRQPIFAGFARVQHNLADLRRQYTTGLELQWIIILPLSVGVAVTAPEVAALFLGDQWGMAASLIPIIALYGILDNFGINTHAVFIVLNRQARMTLSYAGLIIIRLLALAWAASNFGLLGAVWALLGTALLNTVIWQALVGKVLELPLRAVAALLWRGAVAALAMAAAVTAVPDTAVVSLGLSWPVAALFLAKVALGAVVYVALVVLCWRLAGAPSDSAEAHLLRVLRAVLIRIGLPL